MILRAMLMYLVMSGQQGSPNSMLEPVPGKQPRNVLLQVTAERTRITRYVDPVD